MTEPVRLPPPPAPCRRAIVPLLALTLVLASAGLSGCSGPGPTQAAVDGLPAPGGTTEAIPLIRHGRFFTVPAEINGAARLEFVIDSGSTDMVLPAAAIITMLRQGMLGEQDFIGHAGYRLADGSVLVSPRFVLRQVRVGHHTVRNVTASVGEVEGLPLLGQSFLSRFASWAIDNKHHALVLTGR
jgi:predicted aspartyl protease